MYQYKIKLDGNEPKVICGLVAGNTYQMAMDNLVNYIESEYTIEFMIECTLQDIGTFDDILVYSDNVFDITIHLD